MKKLLHYSLECAKYVILSYNDEGIINKEDWVTIMEPYNIKKYEIKIDIDLYMFTYNNITKDDLKLETETNKNRIIHDQCMKIFNECTDFSQYVIYSCSINYLIIHQDRHFSMPSKPKNQIKK